MYVHIKYFWQSNNSLYVRTGIYESMDRYLMKTACTINDKWTYNNMKVVFLENEYLKIGVLADRGSDIFQFLYKPGNLDLMLKLDKDIINPKEVFSQMRDTTNQFEDYYYGGWQEILPNSPAMDYRGASLGQHGEVSLIPWNYSIINNSKEEVSLKLWTRPLRYPVLIEKTLTLRRGSPKLYIDEVLINESDTELQLMWGHHIAFGLPFLSKGATIKTSATTISAEETMPEHRAIFPGKKYTWPSVEGIDGNLLDASKILPSNTGKFSELGYMEDFRGDAYYCISTDKLNFSLQWDKSVFKTLWYWQERYATQDSPWWGKTYAVALEPWTSKWHQAPSQSTMDNEWLKLKAREEVKTSIVAHCHQ